MAKELEDILNQKQDLFLDLEKQMTGQIEGVRKGDYGRRNSMLVFSLQLETKDLVAVAARFYKLYHRVWAAEEKDVKLFAKTRPTQMLKEPIN